VADSQVKPAAAEMPMYIEEKYNAMTDIMYGVSV
jgi:hypothetical protein